MREKLLNRALRLRSTYIGATKPPLATCVRGCKPLETFHNKMKGAAIMKPRKGWITPAHAGPHSPARQQYLEQPATSNVRPVSATVLSGSVSNPGGLTPGGRGTTTLTVTSSDDPATVLLDYGIEVEGT